MHDLWWSTMALTWTCLLQVNMKSSVCDHPNASRLHLQAIVLFATIITAACGVKSGNEVEFPIID